MQQKIEKKKISSVPALSEKSNRIADTLCFLVVDLFKILICFMIFLMKFFDTVLRLLELF